MSTSILSLILDVAVLAALVGTIYYAQRLSKSLNNFRAHRSEMKNLIAELSKNINEAQSAIAGLKATSNIAADNLDDVLHDSRRMGEELRLINETSESLAKRLEKLASQPRAKATQNYDEFPEDDFESYEEESFYEEPVPANTDSKPGKKSESIEPPSFFIQDREFEADETDHFISEAEKELLQALQSQKKSGRR